LSLALHDVSVSPRTSALGGGNTVLDVVESAQLEAGWLRVFYALTLPEYIEAWLRLPEAARIECLPESNSLCGDRIERFLANSLQQKICASRLLTKSHKITYLWEQTHAKHNAKSVVEFRLRGGSHRSVIKLRHQGFLDHRERDRHARIWQCSLEGLRRLMK
jgi:hypothetical protein